MKKNKEKVLNDFIDSTEESAEETKNDAKKVVIDEREGLIERLDRTLVTSDGRQLLREQY